VSSFIKTSSTLPHPRKAESDIASANTIKGNVVLEGAEYAYFRRFLPVALRTSAWNAISGYTPRFSAAKI
jgi:hypothetical protein